MASNVMESNGHVKPGQGTLGKDIKILVVGERRCGKTSFIEVFHKKNGTIKWYNDEFARVYPCQYEMGRNTYSIKIFEIVGGADEILERAARVHTDTNGFILMYAIDDPTSFLEVVEQWHPALNSARDWYHIEPIILVGTKRDLREDPEVIQRLAQNNQAPVTQQQGENLVQVENLVQGEIKRYFDCSSIDSTNVDNAFDFIVKLAIANWVADENALNP